MTRHEVRRRTAAPEGIAHAHAHAHAIAATMIMMTAACGEEPFRQLPDAPEPDTMAPVQCVAPVIVNPSFEEPAIPPPFQPFTNDLPGWTGVVDIHHTTDLPAFDGAQTVDLNQAARVDAPLAQAVTLVAGATYELRFAHGINHNCNASATLEVRIGGAMAVYASDATVTEERLGFVAQTAATAIEFRSLTEGCGAATIDHVRVTCVPSATAARSAAP